MSINNKLDAVNRIEVLEMIIEDMENDVREFTSKPFDGKPFNGETLGELHGNLAAAILALANIMKKHIEESLK